MGEIADGIIENFITGKWGICVGKKQKYKNSPPQNIPKDTNYPKDKFKAAPWEPTLWKTRDGRVYEIKEMANTHLHSS